MNENDSSKGEISITMSIKTMIVNMILLGNHVINDSNDNVENIA